MRKTLWFKWWEVARPSNGLLMPCSILEKSKVCLETIWMPRDKSNLLLVMSVLSGEEDLEELLWNQSNLTCYSLTTTKFWAWESLQSKVKAPITENVFHSETKATSRTNHLISQSLHILEEWSIGHHAYRWAIQTPRMIKHLSQLITKCIWN